MNHNISVKDGLLHVAENCVSVSEIQGTSYIKEETEGCSGEYFCCHCVKIYLKGGNKIELQEDNKDAAIALKNAIAFAITETNLSKSVQ